MQIQYLGHAGCLIREDDIIIAYDPFLSGEFLWNGKLNTYKGQSPWIGSNERIERFSKEFGPNLKAILISHAHMDHFDPYTINALMTINPEIEIFAPYPVIEWLRASSMIKPELIQFLAPIVWDGRYEIEGKHSELEIIILPNSGIKRETMPYRVGYIVKKKTEKKGKKDGNIKSIFLVGDSSPTEYWNEYSNSVSHLFTWGKAVKNGIIEYFNRNQILKHVWINHWEAFTPGNFDCNQEPLEVIEYIKKYGVSASILPYNEWMDII